MDLNKPILEQFSGPQSSVSDAITSATDTISSGFNNASSADLGNASSEFLNSNSIISKFVFLLLVLIVFIMLMNLGVYTISYFLRPNTSPYVVKGLMNGNLRKTIPQDPTNSNAVTIYRSNNEDKGIEFTWTIWLRVDALPTINISETIFSKGNGTTLNGPTMTLHKGTGDGGASDNTGTIKIKMDTVANEPSGNVVEIKNIPISKWFNIAVRMQNKIMDVYVNGVVANRHVFQNVPKQNYSDIIVGGFTGNLSDLRYFDSALNVFQINNIVMAGPNLKTEESTAVSRFDYLSSSWYKPQA
jgi:hypothetical protein